MTDKLNSPNTSGLGYLETEPRQPSANIDRTFHDLLNRRSNGGNVRTALVQRLRGRLCFRGFSRSRVTEEILIRLPFKKSAVVAVGLCPIVLLTLVAASQRPSPSSKYVNPAVYDGLFYVVSGDWRSNTRALVLSYSDNPIEPKANDPDAPTIPGFYPSREKRFDFERVEVVRNKVYFKTRGVEGISYVFSGTSGKAGIRNFDPTILVPFIRGSLVTLRNGKAIKSEKVKFGHAVIA
jgi:hypothetical protein